MGVISRKRPFARVHFLAQLSARLDARMRATRMFTIDTRYQTHEDEDILTMHASNHAIHRHSSKQ